jgi:selenocysteine lyase/cysteine desulfurase
MRKLGGTHIFGPTEDISRKVGVRPFTVDGMDHALVATILSAEGGIGVRNGNFCAQPYMRKLLDVSPEEERAKRAARCDNPTLPGMVRASFGCYNNEADIDRFMEMLTKIVRKEYMGKYSLHPLTGMYVAEGYDVSAGSHFGHFDAPRRTPSEREA